MKNTPQTKAVLMSIKELGHATNRELHAKVLESIPDISLPSVHRITRRLVEAGYAQCTQTPKGVSVVDARTDQHSHFNCERCDHIVDIDIPDALCAEIEQQLGAQLTGRITVAGVCKGCAEVVEAINKEDT